MVAPTASAGSQFSWADAPAPTGQSFTGPSLASLLTNDSVIGQDPSQDPQAMATLAAVQKYDPNASWVGGLGSDNNVANYQLEFDPSKLPNASGNGPLAKGNGEQGFELPFTQTPSKTGAMFNPSLTYQSGPYGNITPNANINHDYGNTGFMGMLSKVAPYAVMAALAYGGGLAGGSLLGGTSLSSLGPTLGKFGMNELLSGGKTNPLSLVSGAIPGAIDYAGLGAINPYLNAIKNIYGATQGNVGSMLNLGRMGLNSLGGH